MHDIDRTQMEFTPESGFETEQWESGIMGRRERPAERGRRNAARLGAARRQHRSGARSVPRQPDQEGGVGDWLGRALPDRPGGRRRAQERREEGAAARRRRALAATSAVRSGAKIGSGLASAAGSALGLEAESWRRRTASSRAPSSSSASPPTPCRKPPRHRRGGQPAAAAQAAATAPHGSSCPDSSARPARRARCCRGGPRTDRDAGCGAAARSSSTACDEALMSPFAAWMLTQEARALLTRLGRVRPFALLEPMVPAAALLPTAQSAIEEYLVVGRRSLRRQVARASSIGCAVPAGEREQRPGAATLLDPALAVQRRADPVRSLQRRRSPSAASTTPACGCRGSTSSSADALALAGQPYQVPPIICYLDRGAGAAIRRARTRLPGGGANPVAIIRVPRERMVGSGIASSLFHEVGHQAARAARSRGIAASGAARHAARRGSDDAPVWQYLGALDLRDRRRLLGRSRGSASPRRWG